MSLSAREENAKTLASVFGLADEEAAQLLDMVVGVRAAPDAPAQAVRRHIVALLARSVATVREGVEDTPGVEIVIGSDTSPATLRVVRVGITSAEVVISCEATPAHDARADVPEIVLLIAACYASAMAVRVGIGAAFSLPSHDTIRLPVDLLVGGRSVLEGPIELGKVYLAGAGAIGNGFVWALATVDARGELHIVDPKNVSSGNLGRCLWFEAADIGRPKAERLASRAQPSLPGLTLIPRAATIQTLTERNAGPWLERVVVGVDSRRARRRLQEELPGEVFDASTTGIEEIVVHVNSAWDSGACLSCVYHEDAPEAAHEQHVASMLGVELADVRQHYVSEDAARRIALRYSHLANDATIGLAYDTLFKTLCATGKLSVEEGRTVLAPLGFVSALAGAYLAIEVFRGSRDGQIAPPYNYWRASPWTSPVLALRTQRPALAECETCGDVRIRATVRSLWGTNGKRPT